MVRLCSKNPDGPRLSCPTCKDEGVPVRVVSVDVASKVAVAWLNGEETELAIDLLDDVRVGDVILIHLDMAIAKLNPADVIEA
jgi:hydrogenase expression/formation protein HypC